MIKRRFLSIAAFALAAAGVGGNANALTDPSFLSVYLAVSDLGASTSREFAPNRYTACGKMSYPALGAGDSTGTLSQATSKSAAILGGRMSNLERIALQQSGEAQEIPGHGIFPAAGPCSASTAATPGLGHSPSKLDNAVLRSFGSDDFLASRRLTVAHTAFDTAWKSTGHAGLSRKLLPASVKSYSHDDYAKIRAVNAWANRTIRYEEDRKLYGEPDHWARASETVQRGAGDCEDIAIAKLQALAALGVPRQDLYLTIARDLARNADHAILIVKVGGRFWMLDNATDQILDASEANDYRPILTFGSDRNWVHGY